MVKSFSGLRPLVKSAQGQNKATYKATRDFHI